MRYAPLLINLGRIGSIFLRTLCNPYNTSPFCGTTANQPTGHQMSLQSLFTCARESIFLGKNGRFQFKDPYHFVREQKFWYPYIKKPLTHLVCIVLLVGHCTKWIRKANIWPKQMHIFWPNLAYFGPKILIFMGVSKSFGTNITENHLGNLSALFFGQAIDQMGQKCPYLAKNASFGQNLAIFGQKIQFLGGRE